MTLMDYCMQYIGEIMDGKRAAPEGVTLTETDPMRRSLELMQKAGDIPTLVRMCAAQDGTEIPQEVFDSFDPESLTQLAREGDAAPEDRNSRKSRTRTPESTPSRCCWTAWPWMTAWCSI